MSIERINYILYHLFFYFDATKEIEESFCFETFENILLNNYKKKIIFPLSSNNLINPITVRVLNKDIPILYPQKGYEENLFKMDNSGNLIFTHDYLKSAFYFLSGEQELQEVKPDNYGRFPYNNSIQKKLNCTTIPVVNYYFEIILQGIELFCNYHGIAFKRKRVFEKFGFLLSHDVDEIAFFHWRMTAHRIKQMLGLAPSIYSNTLTFKLIFKGILFLINPFPKKDPWWNFEEMIKHEKKHGISSTFYFLHDENHKFAQSYKFGSKKIHSLINTLKKNGFEVNIHGTMFSANNKNDMKLQATAFLKEFGVQATGIRQHFLCFMHPKTFELQEEAGFKYDTTLAFAEHEGYRNGYCFPFKPYNFEKEQSMKIWEIPLIMMDANVQKYRKLTLDEIKHSISNLIEEATKFGGIFSLLWHNSRMTKYETIELEEFYNVLIKEILEKQPETITAEKLLETIDNQ